MMHPVLVLSKESSQDGSSVPSRLDVLGGLTVMSNFKGPNLSMCARERARQRKRGRERERERECVCVCVLSREEPNVSCTTIFGLISS